MRMAELSARSAVPIPSIKLYIREGLLPAGTHTAKNQARYTTAHLEQLQLIRSLRDVLDMPLAQIARVVAAQAGTGHDRVQHGLDAAVPRQATAIVGTAEQEHAWKALQPVMRKLGWRSSRDAVAVQDTLRALVAIAAGLNAAVTPEVIARYAKVAQDIAAFEIPDDWDPSATPEGSLRYAVLGTLLFEPLILALRRIAHGERSAALTRAGGEPVASPRGAARPGSRARTRKAPSAGRR
jgi:DNA-binding transcriptional MerR regulator